jgi:hypothetical protein
MATINVIKKATSSASTTEQSSTNIAEGIVLSTINGISFIEEDLTKQVDGVTNSFSTSFLFLSLSLEVFINGLKMSRGYDFLENTSLDGFSLILTDVPYNKFLPNGSSISVKYIKKD